MEIIEVKEVNEKLPEEIKEIIVSEVNPVKLILLGSYAYRKPHKGSDPDILVTVDNLGCSRRDMQLKIRRLPGKYLIPKDIIVATVKDGENWKNVKPALLTSIIRKGRLLYER